MPTSSHSSANSVREQALAWLVRLHSGHCDQDERARFEAWLAADPAHRAAYRAVSRAWHDLPRPQSELAAARAYRPRRRERRPLLALAAVLVLALGLGVRHEGWPLLDTHTYRTAKGERQTLRLGDGSQVELNTDTEIKVGYGWRRHIDLVRGEALFTVAEGAWRPFEVGAGGGVLRDIGTRFDVYVGPRQTQVAVLDGWVRLRLAGNESRDIGAGQGAAYRADTIVAEPQAVDAQAAALWREGRVAFHEATLDEALAQMTRYFPVEVAFAEAGLKRLKLSGRFGTANLPLFLATLEATLPVQARLIGGRVIRVERGRH